MQMDENFFRYSALDSACMLEIEREVWKDITPYQATYDMTLRLFPVLMYMQTRGVAVSHALLNETKTEVLRAAKDKQEELDAIVGRPLNVNSSKQCAEYFYGELGIPPIYGKKKTVTTDDQALQRLVRGTVLRPSLRQAKLVQEIRGLQKLYGTYLDIKFDSDNRMRGSYNPRGTKFGRLSSSKTINNTGMNFQNLPPEFKKFIVADPGYVMIEVDKRQAEWVAVAYITGDANMIAAIESGTDVHVHTASLMFGVEPNDIKLEHKLVGHSTDGDTIAALRAGCADLGNYSRGSWPRSMSLRQCGKKSNHGLNYDEGYRGFAMINEMDEREAKRIVEMYHKIYPGIHIWYETVKRQLQKDRTLSNCFGRIVQFLDAWGDKLWKSAYSMQPQSTVVDGLNGGMVAIYEDTWLTRDLNLDVLAQVHDSILMQIPIEHVKNKDTFNEVIRRITDYTSPDMTYNSRTFKIASDYKCGFNWGGQGKTNELGMRDMDSHEDLLEAITAMESVSGPGTLELA